ncbi:SDR family oxidoreductase [Afifella sp. IM 167]|uniref:SDR family oxidoreductase n=1 Tax=Afifella sp. IM 167 TaxID=2033586 RepID=UPI001CCDA8FF|nr:SDR family oxidoreductase [Afifella sp. IM 167]MBZ8134469.1 short-chain dehydrogenase [Afifella sp. IM 167]
MGGDGATSEERVAIVTGASRGLGRAIALAFAAKGVRPVVTARDGAALDEVAAAARSEGAPDALAVAADLSQTGEPQRVVEAALARFGRIDILVNNAGATKRGDFLALPDEDHLAGFALKYHATVRFCRSAWPHLARAGGAIVNISGIGAQTPVAEFTIGGPVNSALVNFTKAIAARGLHEGIRINCLCPGHIETDRLTDRIHALGEREGLPEAEARERLRQEYGIGRFGKPGDIAAAVLFLCSQEASYIHGATIVVDGGATPGI